MKLRKVKNPCLPIVPSVRLSSYKRRIQKLRNKRNKLRKRKNTDHAQRLTTSKDARSSEIRSDGNVTNI